MSEEFARRLAALERAVRGESHHAHLAHARQHRRYGNDVVGINMEEADGSPAIANVHTVIVSNGTLTDNADGTATLTTGGGGGGGAPTTAQYLVLAADATLTQERIWTPGSGLAGSDGGAGAAYTVNLGDLTVDWTQGGNFDIRHLGQLLVGGTTWPAGSHPVSGDLDDYLNFVLQSGYQGIAIGKYGADGTPAILTLIKARGTAAAPGAPNSSDNLGFIDVLAWDGVAYQYVGVMGWDAVNVPGGGGQIESRWYLDINDGTGTQSVITAGQGVWVVTGLHIEAQNNDNTARELRLYEPSGGGSSYTGFKAPALGGNVIYSLPTADGSANQVLKTDGSGALAWTTPSAGHTVHEETGAALTSRAALHFMGGGVTAADNAGSSRTEVVVGTVYDAIVDSADTNAAGKGNVYSTLQAAITAGHNSILFRSSTDGSDITIASTDSVSRIVGDSSLTASVPVNIRCEKTGVLFDSLTFASKKLVLAAAQCRAFACIFSGTIGNPTALLNGALTESGTSMPFDGGANGGVTSLNCFRIDNEYLTVTSGGAASSGTATVIRNSGFFTAKVPHSDNATITDICVGHLEIQGTDCEVTACFWIGCSNTDANCVYIPIAGARARITACGFLSNSTFSCIAIHPNASSPGGAPANIEVVGSKFSENTTKNALITMIDKPGGTSGGHLFAPKINGCSFSVMHYGAIRLQAIRANFSGNTFTSGNSAAANRTNLVDFSGGLSGAAATDKSIPFDTDGGTIGTRPDMGLVEIGSELLSYSARKTDTTSGTSTATSATTLTDSGAAWTTDEWLGQILVAGTSWGIVTANTATVMTVDSWRGGTPGATSAYAIRPSLVGCVRGIVNSTAAAATDNATITYRTEHAIEFLYSNSGIPSQGNVVSGNTFTCLHTAHLFHTTDTTGALQNMCSTLFSGNSLSNVTRIYAQQGFVYATNQSGALTFDGRSLTGIVIVASASTANLTLTNMDASTVYWTGQGVSGVPTGYRLPDAKTVELGAAAGNLTCIAIPLTNATGANSVKGNIAALSNAANSSFIDNPGAASNRVCGVQMETGIANGSDCMVAVAGVVQVLCTTAAVVRGDLLATSATAGQAATAAGGHGTILGKALEAKAAGATGLVRCLLALG